jgi:hypothetical protein
MRALSASATKIGSGASRQSRKWSDSLVKTVWLAARRCGDEARHLLAIYRSRAALIRRRRWRLAKVGSQ